MKTAFYVLMLLFILLSSRIISQDSAYMSKAYKSNFILKKNLWPISSIDMSIDTSLKFSFFINYNYDLNLTNIHAMDTIIKKVAFSKEKIKVFILDEEKIILKAIVSDTLGNKLEEGLMKAIGPCKINILQDEAKNWQYFYDYYLLKIGKWKVYTKEAVRLVNYDYYKSIDVESQSIKDIKDMAKRRKKFIKRNKLSDDYVE